MFLTHFEVKATVLCPTGIRQLQLMLLKVALIVAVEFHINVEFVKLVEPPENQEKEGISPFAAPSILFILHEHMKYPQKIAFIKLGTSYFFNVYEYTLRSSEKDTGN